MKKAFSFVLLLLILVQSSFAYIDPGTGGYLISVVWQYIVAFFAFVSASIVFFFKHKVFVWWQNKWVKFSVILSALLIVGVILYFMFNQPAQGGLL
jgi:hypothetical protein